MEWKKNLANTVILGTCLILLQGCLGATSLLPKKASIAASEKAEPTLPPAQPGNILVAINDEAPVIRNDSGEPIRTDRESQSGVVHYEGFNEE